MNIKKHIPNAITCGNLLCGCLAIVKAFEGDLVWAAYLVGIAAVLDFFDGFAARMLKVSSPIGKDLDSLADMVTFGVVPGVVMFQLMKGAMFYYNASHIISDYNSGKTISSIVLYFAFLIPIFSAIRLAKFNNDTRQSESFIGLPTPANGIFICSLGMFVNNSDDVFFTLNNWIIEIVTNPYILICLIILLSYLLIAELPLFALKFKHFKWTGNEIRFLFLGLCLIILVTLQFVGIPLIIILYVLLSVINNIFSKSKSVE